MRLEYLLGLVGDPVSHSLSPAIHREFLSAAGLAGEYSLHGIPSKDFHSGILSLMRQGYAGVNVTVPHKRAAAAICERLGKEAVSTGAVNTLVFMQGELRGENTDVAGASKLLENLSPPFLVAGAGGAALAVRASVPEGRCVLLRRGGTIPDNMAGEEGTIVNATPLGWNDDDPFPFPVPPGWAFADLNYNPGWTFRNRLRDMGTLVVTGELMLVEQAARSFFLWTGYTPDERLKSRILSMIRAESNVIHRS